jgi:hypothetical protein
MSIENAPQIPPPNNGVPGYGVTAESAKLLHFVAATATDHNPQPKVVPLDKSRRTFVPTSAFPMTSPSCRWHFLWYWYIAGMSALTKYPTC